MAVLNLYLSDVRKEGGVVNGIYFGYPRPILSADKKTLTFIDTTGAYSGVSNLNGWGVPNTLVSQVPSIISLGFTIWTDSSTSTSYALKSVSSINNSPSIVNDLVYNVTVAFPTGSTLLTFPDGFYQVDYVSTNGPDIDYTGYFVITRTVEETITQHALALPDNYAYLDKFINNMGSDEILDTTYEIALLNSIKNTIPTLANKQKILDTLSTLQNIISEV